MVKVIKNEKEMEKYYKENLECFEFKCSVHFKFDVKEPFKSIVVDGDIIADGNIYFNDVDCKNIRVKGDIHGSDIDCFNITAKNISCWELIAGDIKTDHLSATKITAIICDAKSIDVDAMEVIK